MKMKRVILLLMLTVGAMLGGKAQSVASTNSIHLSQKDKQNSLLFQSLKGKDRLNIAKQLQLLVRVKGGASDVVTTSNRFGAKTTTATEIVALLGEPDATLQQSMFIYNLKPGTSSKLVIGLDKDKLVQFCTIKNL